MNVSTKDIPKAAFKVWQSGVEDHIGEYQKSKGLNKNSEGPAVLVQTMLDPRCAGVAFSADPVSGRRDHIVISAIAGLADRLVNGEEDGETYQVDKSSGEVIQKPDKGLLSNKDIEKIKDLCIQAEQYFGRPQDIEWAIVGRTLYLLQSRPITTPLRPLAIKDNAKIILDNSNIVESYPGLVTPLTFSFAQYAYSRVYRQFVSILGVSPAKVRSNAWVFDNMLSRVNGRVYYNLLNWYRALSLLPGFSINRDFMETMMGVDDPLPEETARSIGPEPATRFAKVREYLSLIRVSGRLLKETIRMRWTRERFMDRLNNALSNSDDELEGLSLRALAAEYRRVESLVLDQWDAPLINDFLCMIAFGLSRSLMEKWGG